MKRLIDLCLALILGFVLMPLAVLVAILVRVTSAGPALYWSDRVGRDNVIFKMPKFRTMRIGAPTKASHEFSNAASWLTPVGSFLRRTSLDEIPQLWSILKDDMSFVGPRPALFNQHDLIAQRSQAGVHHILPGLTGWAQVNGRDQLSLEEKVKFDAAYLSKKSLWFDFRILGLTCLRVVGGKNISH